MPTSTANLITANLIAQLQSHLTALNGPRDPYLNSGKHQLAQQYIRTEFGRWGSVTAQKYLSGDREYFNWQLALPGLQQPDSQRPDSQRPDSQQPDSQQPDSQQPDSGAQLAPLIVGAHYDTVPGSPGADDNASGVAVLLCLAELLSKNPPRRPVYLIAFDLEEYGLVGSTACAQSWRAAQRPIHLMLSLEMLGYFTEAPGSQQYPLPALKRFYPETGNFIALIGNLSTVFAMRRLKKSFGQAGAACQWLPIVKQGKPLPAVRRSDHAPFWDAGYRAILVTDTANLRNPHYHTASDQIETLDVGKMAAIAQGLATGLGRL